MKYFLVIVLVWVAFMIWRARRRDAMRAAPPPTGAPPAVPQAMLRCAHCGVHLPAGDALPGKDGEVYCSTVHREAGQV